MGRILKIAAAVVLSGAAAGACATLGPPHRCNPIMVRCNEADLPPLTAMLPKSPIPPPLSNWAENVPVMERNIR